MANAPRHFVLADIHGDMTKLDVLWRRLTLETRLDLTKDHVVQLGDKNDRGPETFEVFEHFRKLHAAHPKNVHMILGNHERMLIDVALRELWRRKDALIWHNGGLATLESYARATGKPALYNEMGPMLRETGHADFLAAHVPYLETPEYFFCHAPQENRKSRKRDWKSDEHCLTWTYINEKTQDWVDRELIPGKISAHGHIHGLKFSRVRQRGFGGRYGTVEHLVEAPRVRRYGSSLLVDTGCGCHDDGVLSCVILPDLVVYNSKGETYSLA